ncbi:hypothetical protein D3C72_2249220 [compost metagenome]
MALPDEVAQVVVELLARRHPHQLELEVLAGGQLLRQLDIDAAGLAVLLEAVGREVLVYGDLEHARGDDVIERANLRLRDLGKRQQTAQHQDQ